MEDLGNWSYGFQYDNRQNLFWIWGIVWERFLLYSLFPLFLPIASVLEQWKTKLKIFLTLLSKGHCYFSFWTLFLPSCTYKICSTKNESNIFVMHKWKVSFYTIVFFFSLLVHNYQIAVALFINYFHFSFCDIVKSKKIQWC